MSELINREGHLINADGSLKGDPAGWDAAAWEQSIEEAIAEHERRTGEDLDESQIAFAAVQPGDWQWKIANKYGADPAATAYENNEQFNNPDLIHPGDVVMLVNPQNAPGAIQGPPQTAEPEPEAEPAPPAATVPPELQPIQDAAAEGDWAMVDMLVAQYLDGAKTLDELDERFQRLQQNSDNWGSDDAKQHVGDATFNYVTSTIDNLGRTDLGTTSQLQRDQLDEAIMLRYLESLPPDQQQGALTRLFEHDWKSKDYALLRVNNVASRLR